MKFAGFVGISNMYFICHSRLAFVCFFFLIQGWMQKCFFFCGHAQWYCWWLKSCTTWDVWNPINNGINYQPQLVQDFSHQQYFFQTFFSFKKPNNRCTTWPLQQHLWLVVQIRWQPHRPMCKLAFPEKNLPTWLARGDSVSRFRYRDSIVPQEKVSRHRDWNPGKQEWCFSHPQKQVATMWIPGFVKSVCLMWGVL